MVFSWGYALRPSPLPVDVADRAILQVHGPRLTKPQVHPIGKNVIRVVIEHVRAVLAGGREVAPDRRVSQEPWRSAC
jgi:hypothetical protein